MSDGLLSFHHWHKRRKPNKRGRLKCPWSPVMYCDNLRLCPMEDRGFLAMLERWLMLGRSARGANLESNGQGYQSGGFDDNMIAKADIYRLFLDPDGVDYFLSHHYARMHKRLCKDLSRAAYLWREIQKGFSRVQSEKFYTEEVRQDD